jgi:hypothetical protein
MVKRNPTGAPHGSWCLHIQSGAQRVNIKNWATNIDRTALHILGADMWEDLEHVRPRGRIAGAGHWLMRAGLFIRGTRDESGEGQQTAEAASK